LLTPTCHPAVDEARIASETLIRSDAETLCDSWSPPFEKYVRLGNELQYSRNICGILKVERDGGAAAQHRVELAAQLDADGACAPFDPNYIRAEVRQQHPGERSWTNARHFDHS
jgi:hypothetical protein